MSEQGEINAVEFPLKGWFQEMSQDDQAIIENDIFNNVESVPMEQALDEIKDQEVARGITSRLRDYLEMKNKGVPKEDLKKEAKDLREYINSKVTQE